MSEKQIITIADHDELRIVHEGVCIMVIDGIVDPYAMIMHRICYIYSDGQRAEDHDYERHEDINLGQLAILEQSLITDGYELRVGKQTDKYKIYCRFDDEAMRLMSDYKKHDVSD